MFVCKVHQHVVIADNNIYKKGFRNWKPFLIMFNLW
jgi:hypothetical protein